MTTIEEARAVSRLAADIISDMFEAHAAVERYQAASDAPDKDRWAREFVATLYALEGNANQMREAFWDHGAVFASVNHAPVEPWEPVSSSAHKAVVDVGERYQDLALALLCAVFPEKFPPGEEYPTPRELPAERDLLQHVDIMAESFLSNFPTEEELSRAPAMLEQELARVCAATSTPDAPTGANSANTSALFPNGEPEDERLVRLASRLQANASRPKEERQSNRAIAREITGETVNDEKQARSLLVQLNTLQRKGDCNL